MKLFYHRRLLHNKVLIYFFYIILVIFIIVLHIKYYFKLDPIILLLTHLLSTFNNILWIKRIIHASLCLSMGSNIYLLCLYNTIVYKYAIISQTFNQFYFIRLFYWFIAETTLRLPVETRIFLFVSVCSVINVVKKSDYVDI